MSWRSVFLIFEQICKFAKAMKVGVIMGSVSDYDVMSEAVSMPESFGGEFEKRGVRAHRPPALLGG